MNKQKFFKLADGMLVALQSNVPEGAKVEDCLKEGIDIKDVVCNSEKGQIFHPVDIKDIEFENGKYRFITFSVIVRKEKFKKLVFLSKNRSIAARFGESEPFGFDKTRPGPDYKGRDYLLLAFPGALTGEFAPVYFKIKPRNRPSFLLKVEAFENKDGKIVVKVFKSPRTIPRHLYFK